jgi:hypothetical protein
MPRHRLVVKVRKPGDHRSFILSTPNRAAVASGNTGVNATTTWVYGNQQVPDISPVTGASTKLGVRLRRWALSISWLRTRPAPTSAPIGLGKIRIEVRKLEVLDGASVIVNRYQKVVCTHRGPSKAGARSQINSSLTGSELSSRTSPKGASKRNRTSDTASMRALQERERESFVVPTRF